jgi:hypothetical protein
MVARAGAGLHDGVRRQPFGPVLEVRARGKEDQRGGGQDLCVLGEHLFNAATLFTGGARSCTADVAARVGLRRWQTRAMATKGWGAGMGAVLVSWPWPGRARA